MDRDQFDEERSRNSPVQESMRWQRAEWRLQRVGAVLLFIIVILAACGLFSKGFLSNHSVVSGDGRLEVTYERFGLLDSDMAMTIRELQAGPGPLVVILRGGVTDNFQIQSLQPQPLRATSARHQLTLTWSRDSLENGATIWIGLQPQQPGRYPVTVSTSQGSQVQFTQWIYP